MDRGVAEVKRREVTYQVTQSYYVNNGFGPLRVRELEVHHVIYTHLNDCKPIALIACLIPETEKVKEENGKQTETQTRTENTTGNRDRDTNRHKETDNLATTCVIYWCKRNKKCFANHSLSPASRCINI